MVNTSNKVLIAAPVHEAMINGLQRMGYACLQMPNINQETVVPLLGDIKGIITSTRLQLNKHLLDAAPELEWIGRMGSGMEVIDVNYAQSKGIHCFSSPEGNANAVGEHAVGILLSLIRKISSSGNEIKKGIWKRDENRGIELEGKTIGIIGFGHTGRAFAKKLSGFDMNILAYDKYSQEPVPDYVRSCKGLSEIYNEADIISFHVPLLEGTYHYFNDAFLNSMVKPFILLNTSRGKVVSLKTLHRGIEENKISGVALDVFEEEPLSKLEPSLQQLWAQLVNLPQVIATPHIAGYTFEALFKMSSVLLSKVPAPRFV
jgi:D-3-phosphoglycerate dehydrogenase